MYRKENSRLSLTEVLVRKLSFHVHSPFFCLSNRTPTSNFSEHLVTPSYICLFPNLLCSKGMATKFLPEKCKGKWYIQLPQHSLRRKLFARHFLSSFLPAGWWISFDYVGEDKPWENDRGTRWKQSGSVDNPHRAEPCILPRTRIGSDLWQEKGTNLLLVWATILGEVALWRQLNFYPTHNINDVGM